MKRVTDAKNMADVVEQDRLIELTGRRAHKLQEVHLRNPGLEGKKSLGNVEIHSNGLRYQGLARPDQRVGKQYFDLYNKRPQISFGVVRYTL